MVSGKYRKSKMYLIHHLTYRTSQLSPIHHERAQNTYISLRLGKTLCCPAQHHGTAVVHTLLAQSKTQIQNLKCACRSCTIIQSKSQNHHKLGTLTGDNILTWFAALTGPSQSPFVLVPFSDFSSPQVQNVGATQSPTLGPLFL